MYRSAAEFECVQISILVPSCSSSCLIAWATVRDGHQLALDARHVQVAGLRVVSLGLGVGNGLRRLLLRLLLKAARADWPSRQHRTNVMVRLGHYRSLL